MRFVSLTIFLTSALMGTDQMLAQPCNPANPPQNLTSTYTDGTGALLQWDAVPGSFGVQIRATAPSGATVTRRIVGFERDQFLVPAALLSPGTYTWQVQAACSFIPPYDVTPISVVDTFSVAAPIVCPSTVTDIDGNVYPVVAIGTQCWMQENLKTRHYQNGDSILSELSNPFWSTLTVGGAAYPDGLETNVPTFGLLYNWYAAADVRGLCPAGWHLPTDVEFTELTDYLGGAAVAGGKMKTTGDLSNGTGIWANPNTGATNISGFSGQPAGSRLATGGYNVLYFYGYFWTATAFNSTRAYYQDLQYATNATSRFEFLKREGYSVRCLQD